MIIKTTQIINNAFIVDAVNKKIVDNVRLQRLQDYYEGKHDILLRHYTDTTKPNNRIVVNFCKKIADFLTGYLVGVAVKYDAPQIILDSLNYNDEADTTQQIVRSMNIMGIGCELFYTDADGIPRFANIDARESIFIIDDSIEGNLTAYIRLYPNADNPDLYNVTIYTADHYTEYRLTRAVSELTAIGESVLHFFDDVPVIMYPNNPELSGAYEGIISLQNALNTVMSDEVNDFESFVDAYLVLNGLQGTQPEDIANMKRDRLLLLDENSQAMWLTKNVNNTHIKELKESIISKIHELGCVPDIENMGAFGSSGISLRYKLLHTELQAAKQERTMN
jgi:SPP1 family phage portal protein